MKTAKYDAVNTQQKDQSLGPQRVVLVPTNTTTYGTFYQDGVLGNPTNVTTLVIGMGFKDVNGTYYDMGFGVSQAGRKQFNCADASTSTTLTRATLTAANSSTLVASQCHIRCALPTGQLFHATRITNKFVWNGNTRYPYVTVSDAARTNINQNSGTGVVSTFLSTNTVALVRGI